MRQRWLSRRAFLLHFEFAFLAVGCLAAGWWQLNRALGGNGLSWFYTFEWPAFAGFAIWGWWHLIHEDPETYRARKQRPPDWDDMSLGVVPPATPQPPTPSAVQWAVTSPVAPPADGPSVSDAPSAPSARGGTG